MRLGIVTYDPDRGWRMVTESRRVMTAGDIVLDGYQSAAALLDHVRALLVNSTIHRAVAVSRPNRCMLGGACKTDNECRRRPRCNDPPGSF